MAAKKHEFNSITVSKRGVTTGIGTRRACIVEPKIQNSQFQTYWYLQTVQVDILSGCTVFVFQERKGEKLDGILSFGNSSTDV